MNDGLQLDDHEMVLCGSLIGTNRRINTYWQSFPRSTTLFSHRVLLPTARQTITAVGYRCLSIQAFRELCYIPLENVDELIAKLKEAGITAVKA